MFYMVNPSNLPKKKRRKSKKNKRQNPDLLIVNPYSLSDDEEEEGIMAKKKRKKRKNPMKLRRRRNPDLKAAAGQILGANYSNVKTAALMAVGGGLALGVAQAVLKSRVDVGSNMGKGLIALAAGLGGGIVAMWLGETLGGGIGGFLQKAAVPGAMGAMVLGAWTLAQPFVDPITDSLNAKLGLAGYESWDKEFEGYSPYGQTIVDEYTGTVSPGGIDGLGNVVSTFDPEDVPEGLRGYELQGDIYGEQRLGSFELEPGLGGFVPETANPRDQQVADVMKHKAGHYGDYDEWRDQDNVFESPFTL